MRISIYTNKRNALASPAKGRAKISKNGVNSLGNARGAAQSQPVDTINSKFLPQSATIIPNSSGSAGGAAQIIQANPINYKSWFNFAMKIQNSLISARGAGQVPEPNAINDKSRLVLTINIHNPSNCTGGAAQIPQAHAIIDTTWPLIEDAGPYSAFDLLLDRHHVLMESESWLGNF